MAACAVAVAAAQLDTSEFLRFAVPNRGVSAFTNTTVQIVTRDNVTLNTYLYLPDPIPLGGAPLVLMRTPYNAVTLMSAAADWASGGRYAAIGQDFRGRYGSGGMGGVKEG